MALTRAFNPAIMTVAAITAIILAFVGKIGAFLQTIPVPVMGGILVILFGSIIVVGMNSLVRAGHNLMQPRNLVIIAIILVFGVGGMSFNFGEFALEGIIRKDMPAISVVLLIAVRIRRLCQKGI